MGILSSGLGGGRRDHQVLICTRRRRAVLWADPLKSVQILVLVSALCVCSVGSFKFSFNGFRDVEDLHIVPNSQLPTDSGWQHYAFSNYYYLDTSQVNSAGRIIFPGGVQMRDAASGNIKSFSTSFVFQIYLSEVFPGNGSGMAFIIVPDNTTTGAPYDYMGLMTKDPAADAHTIGVELDTYTNPEFNDPNANHFGLDLGSMNSTFLFEPAIGLPFATRNYNIFRQVWIEYMADESRIDIYYTTYGQGKPDQPQKTWQPVDLSLLLLETMYVGFSSAIGIEGDSKHRLLAWSFSNEGNASTIWIDGQAPPPGATPSPPPPATSDPSPPKAPTRPSSPPTSTHLPPPGPGVVVSNPTAASTPESSVGNKVGIAIAGLFGCILFMAFAWKVYHAFTHPILFFISHSAGKDDHTKDFAESLWNDMQLTWRCKLKLMKVFFDRRSLPKGKPFPQEIQRALDETRVGVVIITEDFFKRKWPMTELVSFVNLQSNGPNKVQILPLFYKLTAQQLKEKLQKGYWDEKWRLMAGSHPLDVEECREAVRILSNTHGTEYNFRTPGFDADYRKTILNDVAKLWNHMVLWSCP